MGVKTHGQRAIILVIVAAFFLSSVGFTGLVIWELTRTKDVGNADTNSDIQKQIEELSKKQGEENKLEGTKLEGFTPVEKVESLQVTDITPGTGAEASKEATITAHYTGALAKDGTIFQSSKDTGEPFTSPLSGLIPGWQQGIPGMKAGGKRRILIPAAQAYGATERPGIPANSDLVFDIELIETK